MRTGNGVSPDIRDQFIWNELSPRSAAKLLGAEPIRTVVIEDAISGVEAGSNGKFGLVIGVARKGNAEELKRHGAHLVVEDLGELVE
jgi:beta-phosphoglucomutase-like phosphatase (HAD superfamily)